MRILREIHPNCAVVQVRQPGREAAWTALPLAAAAVLPWIQDPPRGPWWLYPTLLTVTFVTAWVCTRSRRVRIPLAADSMLRLERLDSPDDPRYRLTLVAGGAQTRLLEHASLGAIVRDLGRILDATELGLEAGADLPAEYFRSSGIPLPPPTRSERIESRGSTAHLRGQRAVWGAVWFVASVFGWSLWNAQTRPSGISLTLPAVAIVVLILIALWLRSERLIVDLSPAGIRAQQRIGWRSCVLFEIAPDQLCGAASLGPAGSGDACHVVLATTRGPRVLTLDSDSARRLVEDLGVIPPLPREGSRKRPTPDRQAASPAHHTAIDERLDTRRTRGWTRTRARQW